jgi:hypothetical protein
LNSFLVIFIKKEVYYMAYPFTDTASTLSVNYKPGQDIRLNNSNSLSIFTFGDYRLETQFGPNFAGGSGNSISFGAFSSLESLKGENFERRRESYVLNNELNLPGSDPKSYSYYSNFYSLMATSINKIVKNFPYALLSYDNLEGRTIYDYYPTINQITGEKTSTFKIPHSAVTNQGDVLINSGGTADMQSLVRDLNKYGIQLSAATSASTEVYNILSYSYNTFPDANLNYLEFTIDGLILGESYKFEDFIPIYIRPKKEIIKRG